MKKWIIFLLVSLLLLSGCKTVPSNPDTQTVPSESVESNGVLSSDTSRGVGVLLNYADETRIVFQGEFGLFGYDLEKREVTFAFNLMHYLGTANFQGAEDGAVVRVSSDGSTVLVYRVDDIDDIQKDAFLVDFATGAVQEVVYAPLENSVSALDFEDGSLGQLIREGENGAVGTVSDLRFERDGASWLIFENYQFA